MKSKEKKRLEKQISEISRQKSLLEIQRKDLIHEVASLTVKNRNLWYCLIALPALFSMIVVLINL